MLSWVDGKKVFFLPPDRGQSAGRRRAIEMRCGLRTATPSTLVLPALQEHQLQATSAQTRKTCVCAAAVCFLVLLLPRSCSRPCSQPLKKTKCREVLLFRHHTSATSPRLPLPILFCFSALGRHPASEPASAPLNASDPEDRHRGPYQQA